MINFYVAYLPFFHSNVVALNCILGQKLNSDL